MPCPSQASHQDNVAETIGVDSPTLAIRLKQRDAAAMIQVYDRYAVLLFSALFRIVANKAVAEDLLQDVFFRIWNRVDSYDEQRGCFESWIVTVARHCAIDHVRSCRNSLIDSKSNLDDVEKVGQFFWPETGNEGVLSKIAVERALKTLNRGQREILEMVYFKGFTQTEIASLLNKPLGTVKSHVRMALQIVRDTLVDAKPLRRLTVAEP